LAATANVVFYKERSHTFAELRGFGVEGQHSEIYTLALELEKSFLGLRETVSTVHWLSQLST
jgi:hypothetical protein